MCQRLLIVRLATSAGSCSNIGFRSFFGGFSGVPISFQVFPQFRERSTIGPQKALFTAA